MEWLAAFLGSSNNRVFICIPQWDLALKLASAYPLIDLPCLKTDTKAYFPLSQACVAYLKVTLQDSFSSRHKKYSLQVSPKKGYSAGLHDQVFQQ
jgi:hypothetical protein